MLKRPDDNVLRLIHSFVHAARSSNVSDELKSSLADFDHDLDDYFEVPYLPGAPGNYAYNMKVEIS